ncbi:MAG: cysteine--tRNA ligase [Puniceicoccales bacterium]|nr:cysteine--tRNA ligase [Puniceicoccales bacterium]
MAEELRLYDTMERTVGPVSRSDKKFGIYCCGPTVYNYAHIGNFRTFLAVDLLVRALELAGYDPLFVRNLTDIDDKTIAGSQAAGESLGAFTARWTNIFRSDCKKLGLRKPDVEPRATDHIKEQLELIGKLMAQGMAYGRNGSVYFRIGAWPAYGRLSRLSERELRAGDGEESEKENTGDFVLWKATKESDGSVSYASPWGPGRPGWHIECSAMALRYLGTNFAIHCGGVDLCFPHHENEIAQTEAATGETMAQRWFHVAHLSVGGEKMSKSLGNLYTLNDIERMPFSPADLRYALLSGHYRQPLSFTVDSLRSAAVALGRIREYVRALLGRAGKMPPMAEKFEILAAFWEALLDDLNAPKALGEIFLHIKRSKIDAMGPAAAGRELAEWRRLYYAFGLPWSDPKNEEITPTEEILALAQKRQSARTEKNFVQSDQLRDELAARGWRVEDGADGYRLHPIERP